MTPTATIPHNLEAERALLGSVLLDNQALGIALEVVAKDDFFSEAHRLTFEAMCALHGAGTVNIVTLCNRLDALGLTEKCGGAAYLSALTDGVPIGSTDAVSEYAQIVREKATVRRIINLSNNVVARSLEGIDAPDVLIDLIYGGVAEIAQRSQRGGLVDIGTILRAEFTDLEAVYGRTHHGGIETGLRGVDALITGFQPGELIILAARPTLGKTSLMLNIACHAAIDAQAKVAIFSLETTKEALITRLLCSEGEVDSHKLRTGFLSRDDWAKLPKALGRISGAPISIDDASSLTPVQIHTRAKRLQQQKGLDVIFLDYLQLVTPGVKRSNRVEEVSYVSKALKEIAKDLRVPVVALSQLSRKPEDRTSHRPRLSDLRESGSIEQDADTVLFLYHPSAYRRKDADYGSQRGTEVDIIVGKQRNGPTGEAKATFLKPYTRFVDWSPPNDEVEPPEGWSPYKE